MAMRLNVLIRAERGNTPAPQRSEHQKDQSQSQAPRPSTSSPTPRPVPTVFTPTPQTVTPVSVPTALTPKSPKGKAVAKAKPPVRRIILETASSTLAVTSIPLFSTPVKRSREDEVDGATPKAPSAPFRKRVRSAWEGKWDRDRVPNEEARKRDEQAGNVKTEHVLTFFETVTKFTNFINENRQFAETASHALDEFLRTHTSAPAIDAASSLDSRGDPPITPPPPIVKGLYDEFFDFSALYDTPTEDPVTGLSTNPGQGPRLIMTTPGHAGSSSQLPDVKTEDTTHELHRQGVLKEITGGDAMFHHTLAPWEWEEGPVDNPDQAMVVSTS